VRRELERVEIPGEAEAAERARRVVAAALAERAPRAAGPARRASRAAVLAAAAAGALAVAASPAGPALLRSVRHAVGLERAEPALVRLPAAGRLLVDSTAGAWIVAADGSKRLLGRYAESSWSPHGLFELAARGQELAALDPKGNVRWSLEREGRVRGPRWSPDGYRVAYLAGRELRVVAGDGAGDRLVEAPVAAVAPAWRPGPGHVLAYAAPDGAVRVVDADSGARLAAWRGRNRPLRLAWSPDGTRLLGVGRSTIDLLTPSLARVSSVSLGLADPGRVTVAAAVWAPRGRRYAFVVHDAARDRSTVFVQGERRARFQGTGLVDGLAWSPDGRWLLVAWRTADQWVFVRVGGAPRLRAVASISAQFRSSSYPRVGGWCC